MILTPIVIADAPTCAVTSRGVTMVHAATPTYPDSARDLGLGTRYVYIRVTVNDDGSLASAAITQSSHNAAVDQAALRAIRASTFAPMVSNCAAAEGTTLVEVTMDPTASAVAPGGPSSAIIACKKPNTEATITNAVRPSAAATRRLTNAETVVVRVYVNATGGVQNLQVAQSSGDEFVDLAVMKAAHDSTYAPRFVDCRPVAGQYLFRVDIMP